MRDRVRLTVPALVLATALCLPSLSPAQEEETEEAKRNWSDAADFSWVLTAGNSETSTLGFTNLYNWKAGKSAVEVKAGAIRAETTFKDSFTVGDLDNFQVTTIETTDTTTEIYYLNGKYGREISKRTYWFVGAGWDRNIPAGIKNRYMGEAGLSNIWRSDDHLTFRTDYSLTYTDQEDVVENPTVDQSFPGLRLGYTYKHQFGKNTTYDSILILDYNFDESSDYRANFTNSVAVAMNKTLALKVSLQWLYDHEPSYSEINLFDPGDLTTPIGTVLYQLEELDTIFTTSLVVNF